MADCREVRVLPLDSINMVAELRVRHDGCGADSQQKKDD